MTLVRSLALFLWLLCLALPAGAQTGTVTLTCEAGEAQVAVDGKPAGKTPVTLSLPPGSHVIRFTRPGCEPDEQTVMVSAGGTQAVQAALRPPEGPGHVLYAEGGDRERVARAWAACIRRDPALRGPAVLGPAATGWVALASQPLERLAPEAAAAASLALSEGLGAGVVHLAVTPDGRAWYFYSRAGRALDRYCSNPGTPAEVGHEVLRSWAGRPDVLLPVCRGRPLSARRSEVSLTDLNSILYFYYPEMRQTRPGAWRSPTDFMRLLTQVLGAPQPPAPFAALAALPGWKRL